MARKLRIAVSVFFGVLTVSLLFFWVRSYWWFSWGQGPLPGMNSYAFNALDGSTTVTFALVGRHWQLESSKATEFPAMRQVRDLSLHTRFRVSTNSSTITFEMPLWFPTLLCAAACAAVWIPVSFSLRTLLIAMTLFAVVLGLVVWIGG